MDRQHDALVVGAGLSGLTTAALLARRGLAVTVVEAGDRPGGSCSAFRRLGVTYDVGAAMLFGFGERGFNPHRWLMEELGEAIEVYRHEGLYRMNYGDRPVVFWPDMARFLRELEALLPRAKGELEAFYAALGEIYEGVIAKVPVFEAPTEIPVEEGRRRFLADPKAQLRALRLMFRSTESLMRPYVRDPAVRRFFDKLTSTYCYTTLRETPAILAATMFVDNHVGGSYYPAGSAMALAARLEKAVEAAGGVFRYREKAEALLPPSGPRRAPRLRLASGEVLDAEVLVFSGAVKELCAAADPEGLLPKRWKARILAMDDSWPSFVVYGTVRRTVLPEGTLPVEMFIDNTEALDEGDVTLYLPALEDPSLAPEGVCPFLLIGPSPKPWPRPGEAGYGSAEYGEAKRREADRMLGLVERRIKGFRAAMLTRIEGSPSTIERYLGKPRGSVAGPKQRMGQHLFLRPKARSPLPGLYLAGEGTVMGTGTPAVTVSGISAANAVLRDLDLPDYRQGGQQGGAVRIIARGSRGNEPGTELRKAARDCQWCESAACTKACPRSLDIPGIMRRLEAGNLAGALRAAGSGQTGSAGAPAPKAGAGKVAAQACDACLQAPDRAGAMPPCEEACLRRSFAGRSLPVAEVLRGLREGMEG